MMRRRLETIRLYNKNRRSGLATLELVLYLPIMLLLMALMINMGTAGAWKIRTLTNSRQAVWRAMEFRTGADDFNPRNWPVPAEMQVRTAQSPLISEDPFTSFPIVRGPTLTAGNAGEWLPVRDESLDMTLGTLDGFAHIERLPPLLRADPSYGSHFSRDHHVLDGSRWQYRSMGLGSNTRRRVLHLYPADLRSRMPELTQTFETAAQDILDNPHQLELTPLEGHDPEVLALIGEDSPDFRARLLYGRDFRPVLLPESFRYNRVLQLATADLLLIRNEYVEPRVIDRIEGEPRLRIDSLPRRMTEYYIGVYQQAIQGLQDLDPVPEAQIAELQQKIEQLTQFHGTISQ